jgi:hypothetical protein
MTCTTEKAFDSKDPAEIVPLAFEFAALTATPASPVITITQESGPQDPGPLADMLLGPAVVVGSEVRQLLRAGIVGATYRLRCDVTAGGGVKWALSGTIEVATR